MAYTPFGSWTVEEALTVDAPDGSTVRPLAALAGLGSLARFELAPGAVSRAVSHATVQEIWYVTQGTGLIWRRQNGLAEVTSLRPGTAVTIPLGTAFQFRADQGGSPLQIVAVTMPPWPGTDTEARREQGPWDPVSP
ncbi:hypothetical protein GCM10010193_51340 [Kitasatospora atroaurantiaca]|uniref:Cupin domain n=1 Tax=Kitasatospora atroaurantiaca TaxID=285545 RepID=A0A561EY11_9ACTN|nr:cupin domain-containing protein [Kitasatospora atroaurantiaca]TWE20491.1 cupin domain [Kitasatospora atroaurantiaca]